MKNICRVKTLFALFVILMGCTTQPATPPPVVCLPQTLEDYQPSSAAGFVQIEGQQFTLNGEPYPVRGVNYYPARYPWRRFLTETDTGALHMEMSLMREAGFNTLRIFLWNEALFQCDNDDAFRRLDTIIHLAALYNFRLIVTLNDLPDAKTLYTDPPQRETEFIISRYRDEPTIMAWDLRNEGDIDYGTHHAIAAVAHKDEVLRWLETTAKQVRDLDPNHLITAGWLYNAEATAPYVDFVSFHHWTSAAELPARIAPIRFATDKPVLLQEFGYSTQRVTPDEQAKMIIDVIDRVEAQNLAGWMIWAGFDFPIDRTCTPSPCQSPDNQEHYFGLWTSMYARKPVLDLINPD